MKMIHHILLILLSLSFIGGNLNAQRRGADLGAELWKDESFVKSFVGSYAFLLGYEPKISDAEKEVLRSLVELIKAKPKAAINVLRPQVKPKSSAAFDFILANLYFQEGQLKEAKNFYKSATKKYPNFRRAYKNLGLIQVQDGNFKGAIPAISKALELGEVDGRAYGLLAYCYLTEGLYYPAEAAYRQAILIQPNQKDWKIGLARCLIETERYKEAVSLFDMLLQGEPNNSDFWILQSNAYIGNEEPQRAAQNLEIVRRMNKADLSTLTLLGDIYMNNSYPDLALNAYLSAVEMAGPGDLDAILRAANILNRTANYKQAATLIKDIRKTNGTALSPEQDLALLNQEAKIARAEGDQDAAVEILNKIVERDALNGEALIELANHYAEKDMLPEAINRYEQATKIDAYERRALIAYGQTLVRKAKYREALPLLKRALLLEAEPNLEDYTARVERAAKSQG
ncbi:MAG: Beta-barrel assembly-enhancing protease [Opitutia bacterium UBA7350]|nr:MAG: Beta-barrel assembly-enhancing protease [Opitutae bacterium UBA7350]